MSIDFAKCDDIVLVITTAGTKCGLPLVSGGYPKSMISLADIKLGKVASAL